MTNAHKNHKQSHKAKRGSYACVIGIAIIIVVTMFSSLFMGNRMVSRYAQLISAAMNIKYEATLSHLELEEIISGDRHNDITIVWEHLDQSEWYARAMLDGGENSNGVIVSLQDAVLRNEIEEVLVKISKFREIAEKRWASMKSSGVGSEIDQSCDAIFHDFLTQADKVKISLQGTMSRDLLWFRTVQGLLIVISLLISGSICIVIRRFISKQTLDIKMLRQTEAALKLSKSKFKSLVSNIPCVAYRCALDADWTMHYLNDAIEPLTGYPASDFINNAVRSFESVIHSADSMDVDKAVNKAVASGLDWEIEYRVLHKDGSVRWVYEKGRGICEDDNVTFLDGFILDITARKDAERIAASHAAALELSQRKALRMMEDAELAKRSLEETMFKLESSIAELSCQKNALDEHAVVSITDIRGNIIYANEKFCKISGYTREELIGQNHRMIKSDEHSQEFFHDLWKTVAMGQVWSGEVKNRAKDGSYYWVRATIVPFKDKDGKITQYCAIRTDITEHKEHEIEMREINGALTDALLREKTVSADLEQALVMLEELASTDKLTGLPNRGVLFDRLDQVLKQSKRDDNRFAVLFFDFDRFKVVNDSLGHEIGDVLLCEIADIFRNNIRESDTVARIGGDEFVVLLTNLSKFSDAKIKAEEFLEKFAQPHLLRGHSIISTASIGLVINKRTYDSANAMIRDADTAMYQAKEAGKGRVVEFDKAMHQRAINRLALEEDLRNAVAKEQLRLVYQPIVNLVTGELSGFEALVRWIHPERGTIRPADFISIAEETGLIIDIGSWVLNSASHQIADWNYRHNLTHRLSMNVNLSKSELLNNSILSNVLECQRLHKLQPEDLVFEVTESTIVDQRSDVIPTLSMLREHGFHIAMDDFGTGLSSLGALHDYPIDILKIDQSFISALDNDRSLLAVVASITSLAENLKISTVAEGIETKNIVAALQSIGCTWGQGYFFAKPLSPTDADAYILNHQQEWESQAA